MAAVTEDDLATGTTVCMNQCAEMDNISALYKTSVGEAVLSGAGGDSSGSGITYEIGCL
jgi:hypothetical protein